MGEAPAPIGPNDWVAERLAEIDQIADASKQVEALLELEAELLPSPSDVLQRALTATDNLQDHYAKACALSAIAPHLPASEPALLERALTAADNIKIDEYKASALSAIAPHLPVHTQRAVLERALTAADNLRSDYAKGRALSAIAPHLPASEPALLERALTAADNIKDDAHKACALSAIAPHLPASEPALLERALIAADNIKNDEYKAGVLSVIAPHLPVHTQRAVLERALTATDNIKNDYVKARALRAIAPHLPASEPALLERALTAADNNQNDYSQALVLSAIAPHLLASEPALLKRTLTTADNLQDDEYKASVLSAIAPHLPKSEQRAVLERALTAADTIKNDDYDYSRHSQALALSAITPHLPESEQRAVLERALTAADTIKNDDYDEFKALALSAIAPHLPASEPALLERALIAADNIKNDYAKARALSAIAPHLPASEPALLECALTAADNIKNDKYKASALSAIAPHLPVPTQRAVLERALIAADNIKNNYAKARALSAIAPHLPASEPALLKRALTAADNIQSDEYKASALSAIVPHLPASELALLECALIAADNIKNNEYKASVLSAIAPHLPESEPALLERALTAADNLRSDYSKASVLSAIAPHLPVPAQRAVLERALTTADSTKDEYKASALSAIAPHLPASEPALLKRALTTADNIQSDEYKASALSAIAPHLPVLAQRAVLERALTTADNIKNNDAYKAYALSAIAPHLPESEQRAVLERALIAADNIKNDEHKAYALSAIAPHLPESETGLLERALIAAENLHNDKYKDQALSAIAPQISQSNLKRFLEATFSLSDAAKSLASPATRLTQDFLQLYPSTKHSTALNIVKHIPGNADKTKFLSALIPRLAVGLLPNALRLIQETFTSDRYRTETLNNLLPYLSEDQRPEALDLITQAIKNPYYKTSALVELIPLLPIEHFVEVLELLEAKIALPPYRASLLQAIAKAITTPEKIEKLTSVTSKAYSGVAPTDEDFLSTYQHLVGRILNLTYQLKEPKRDDFSYEQIASSIFSQLAPVLKHLAEPEQTAVFDAVTALADPGYQAAVLIALAPHFKDFVQTALTTYTGDDYRHLLHIKIQLAIANSTNPQDLRPIADQLNDDETPYIKSPYRNAEAWVELASHPAGKSHQTKALRAIQELQNNAYLQTQYLQRLIPHLAYQQRFEAANIINDISDPYHQVSARVALARKFPESEFFIPARDGASALRSRVQQIEQLSILALDMPELLPRIIKLAETAETATTPDIVEEEAVSQASDQQGNTFRQNIDRYGILVALAPHIPMRINREVKRSWALSNTITDDLWDRALYLLARGYRDALQGGTLRNDAAQDKDLLDLKDEVNALSGLLLMRDLEPPMTVGILGGWGGGKSYIMHLMQAQMTAIRSRKVDPEVEAWNPNPNHEKLSPYVGHIYQIKFDAWTFAKSDLWASLMQTIFFELNRQISLEQQLARVLAEHPEDATSRAKVLCEAGHYWPVLYKASEQDRQWFLERVLSPVQLAKFKEIHNQGQVDDELWRQLGATYQAEHEKLAQLEAELQRKQVELSRKTQAIRSQVDNDKLNQLINTLTGPVAIILSNRVSKPVFEQIQQDIIDNVKRQLDGEPVTDTLQPIDIGKLKPIIRVVAAKVFEHRYDEIGFHSFLTWFRKNLRLFGLLLFFLVLAILLPIAADALMGWLLPGIDTVLPRLIAVLTPLTPGIASAQALLKSSQKWVEETNLAVKEYEQQLETIPKQLQERQEQIIQDQLTKDKGIAALEAEICLLKEKVNAQRQRIPENVYDSLEAFVSDRIQDGSYEQRLGLMQQVKGDLAELSNRLLPPPADSQEFQAKVEQLQKVFPRGPARVVVYIDDLDRCPPDRVVQVLEAVQLLVKTPLFIAVLAIDERYITRALEQFYKGVLLRHGSPSGTDYLEKIIQIPYRVRPIMANSLETYLRAQVVIQDNATGSTKFSEFSRQEFDRLVECCEQVDLSPRTLKRLTNVYKLFKIVCRTRGTKTTPQVQQAILALLALSGRYPNLMRGVFEAIETCFEEQRDETKAHAIDCDNAKESGIDVSQLKLKSLHLDTPLRDFFIHCQLSTHDQYLHLELGKLQHDALKTDILPRTLTLKDITHEIFNLIRSFSFVGEIGEDPDDYRFNSKP